jgi:protein-tyrosine phosphatase
MPSPARDWQPNLTWLTPHLAVGGSFPSRRAEHLASILAIRAVVDLRTEARDDEAVLRRHGITFLHLPTDDHRAVSQRMLRDGLAFVSRHLDRGERVLVHCEHGIGRSATLALCVLVAGGMAPLDALELAKNKRPLVSPSPAQFEAWTEWLRAWAGDHEVGWTIPAFDTFKAIAYRHLANGPA